MFRHDDDDDDADDDACSRRARRRQPVHHHDDGRKQENGDQSHRGVSGGTGADAGGKGHNMVQKRMPFTSLSYK